MDDAQRVGTGRPAAPAVAPAPARTDGRTTAARREAEVRQALADVPAPRRTVARREADARRAPLPTGHPARRPDQLRRRVDLDALPESASPAPDEYGMSDLAAGLAVGLAVGVLGLRATSTDDATCATAEQSVPFPVRRGLLSRPRALVERASRWGAGPDGAHLAWNRPPQRVYRLTEGAVRPVPQPAAERPAPAPRSSRSARPGSTPSSRRRSPSPPTSAPTCSPARCGWPHRLAG
ncbi:hypothetical protein [Modestobacter roseus]|nr:hypothetical protein [Modestobacter roseus]